MNKLILILLFFPLLATAQTLDEDQLPTISNTKLADMSANTVKMRNNGASGDPLDTKISDLAEIATPAAGDFLLCESSVGTLSKCDVGDLGGGATDWTTTQTSSTADGASNNAFDFQADVNYTLGNVLRVGDAGDSDLMTLNGSGYLNAVRFLPGTSTGSSYITASNAETAIVTPTLRTGTASNGTTGLNIIGGQIIIGRDASTAAFYQYPPIFDNPVNDLSIAGRAALSSATTNIAGGDLNLTGGDGASGSAGLANGGNVEISGGTPYGTGKSGEVIINVLTTAPAGVLGSVYTDDSGAFCWHDGTSWNKITGSGTCT